MPGGCSARGQGLQPPAWFTAQKSIRHADHLQCRGVELGAANGANVTVTEVRALQVEAAIHSAEIEGLNVTSGTRADADSYIAGSIDSSELVNRVRARYGLS